MRQKHTLMFCLLLHWLYIVFYDDAVFHFLWLFVISNWHWQWIPCVLGKRVDVAVLFDLCDLHVSFQAHASHVDISRHENRAQIQAVTFLYPLVVCLSLFFELVKHKVTTGKSQTNNKNTNRKAQWSHQPLMHS